jgi:hypothetical protein
MVNQQTAYINAIRQSVKSIKNNIEEQAEQFKRMFLALNTNLGINIEEILNTPQLKQTKAVITNSKFNNAGES